MDRRTLLKALGLSGLAFALPPLEATAQLAGPPRRLVILHFANGVGVNPGEVPIWTPDSSGGVLDELGTWRSQVALVEGLSNQEPSLLDDGSKVGGNPHIHPSAILLSCVRPRLQGTEARGAGDITFDQIAAREITGGRVPILVAAGYRRDSDPYFRESRISYTGPNDGEDPLIDPAKVWDYCFAGLDTTDPEAEALRARRRSVLEHLEGSAGRLRNALGADDQRRVEEHIAALADLRSRIDFSLTPGCQLPIPPPSDEQFSDGLVDSMFDLIAMALACDATRVVTFSLTAGGGGPFFANTSVARDVMDHDCSHLQSGTTPDDHRAVTAWKVQRFARLLDRLNAVPDADGTTLLDNTVVVFVSEMSYGGGHSVEQLPVVAAGALEPAARGMTLSHPDQPLARLWLAALRSLGINESTVPDFGNAGASPLAGVWRA